MRPNRLAGGVGVAVSVLLIGLRPASADSWVYWPGNGHYYQPVSVPGGISWDDALAGAVAAGGYLATITSAEENEFVFSLIDTPQYWIHYTDGWTSGPWLGGYQPEGAPEPDGGWVWVTGDAFSYTNWVGGMPDNDHGGEDYLQFTAGRRWEEPLRADYWNDMPPESTTWPVVGYVIESAVPEPGSLALLAVGTTLLVTRRRLGRAVIAAAVLAVAGLGAPTAQADDWVYWPGNGHYYQPVSVPGGISWDDALAGAVAAGGYLATITSAEENEFVFSLIDEPIYWNFLSYTMGPWLGGYQPEGSPEPAGGWTWITGEAFGYTSWHPGEPNDDPNEDYLHFAGGWGGPMSSLWNDATANGTGRPVVGYVMESPVPEPTTLAMILLGGLAVFRRTRRG